MRRYEGLFPILGKIGKVSYRVELPSRLKIHPVFHVSYLKPYYENEDDPSWGFSKKAPTTAMTSYGKEVEHIIGDRVVKRWGVPPTTKYLVKWKGLPKSKASWEPVVLGTDWAISGSRLDEDVCGLGWGECHMMLQMSLPIGLCRA